MSTDLVVPSLGESITEAVIGKWLKKVGEPMAANEPVVDLETDKISVQLPAPADGVLTEQRFAEGATVKVGEVIGRITAGAPRSAPPPGKPAGSPAREPVSASAAGPSERTTAPSPAAAPTAPQPELAHAPTAVGGGENGVAVAGVSGMPLSPARRKALREGTLQLPDSPSPSVVTSAPAAATPPAARQPREEVVPMTPLRRTIADRLVKAQHAAAILTTFNEVDMSAVMAVRARYQDEFVKKHGIKLGFMSFFAKACVAALKEYPGLNAEVRGTDIVYKKHYDIGVAVGSGRGLVVPVVRDVEDLSFAEIEKRIAELGTRAKENRLTLDELSGGTFTITNGGIYGSMMSTPLLNFPQTGILGMHNIVKRPVAIGDTIELRPMMYVALSYDHRVVDGREAVQFLVGVKERIEAPERLLFGI